VPKEIITVEHCQIFRELGGGAKICTFDGERIELSLYFISFIFLHDENRLIENI